jgi:DNA-binding MarR family transcriptional regulator
MSDPDTTSPSPPAPVAAGDAKSLARPEKPLGPAGANLLFLREEQIRLTQDMLFFAFRDLTAAADALLARHGMGRPHHRALHFIVRHPGLSVGDLLGILQITKQSLARVLNPLIRSGYVRQEKNRNDRRQRLLYATEKGLAFERLLFEEQRERLVRAYRQAGSAAVEGFRRVLFGIMNETSRTYIMRAEAEMTGLPKSGGTGPERKEGEERRRDE